MIAAVKLAVLMVALAPVGAALVAAYAYALLKETR